MNDLSPTVAPVFEACPPAPREQLLALRELIFEVAESTEEVGPLEEALRWGEPAYITAESGSGTPIRIGWKATAPERIGLFVHCQTDLVDRYRDWFPQELEFEGNRAIVLGVGQPLPRGPLSVCIAAALTYHRDKRGTG